MRAKRSRGSRYPALPPDFLLYSHMRTHTLPPSPRLTSRPCRRRPRPASPSRATPPLGRRAGPPCSPPALPRRAAASWPMSASPSVTGVAEGREEGGEVWKCVEMCGRKADVELPLLAPCSFSCALPCCPGVMPLSLSHTHTLSLSHTHPLSLTHTHTHTHTYTATHRSQARGGAPQGLQRSAGPAAR